MKETKFREDCMAATLYFTRHGETFWNVENKICGATDIAVSYTHLTLPTIRLV